MWGFLLFVDDLPKPLELVEMQQAYPVRSSELSCRNRVVIVGHNRSEMGCLMPPRGHSLLNGFIPYRS